MQTVELKVNTREKFGKGNNRKLRAGKRTPGTVYGGDDNFNVAFDSTSFENLYFKNRHHNLLYNLVFEESDKKILTLLKEVQVHPVRNSVVHADFYELTAGKKLRTKVSLDMQGSPAGVREGGILEHFVWDVEIECLPKDIPDSIVLDISGMNINDSFFIRDVQSPEGVRILDNEDEIVVTIGLPVKEEEVAEAEEGAAGGEAAEGETAPDKEGTKPAGDSEAKS